MEPNRTKSVRSRLVACLIAVTALFASVDAHALEVEVTVPVFLRQEPDSRSPIVARLPAGTRARLLGRSEDGVWLQLSPKGVAGWAPKSFFKTDHGANDGNQ
jgi:uncharacterized protein YraI